MAHQTRLFALSSAAQCPETNYRLSTFFRSDQRGGNRSILALRCGTLWANLFLGIALRTTERTAVFGAPSGAGAVDGQADPATVIEGLVALGTTNHRD